MRPEIAEKLRVINRRFYAEFADSFAESRVAPQPGFAALIDYLPFPCTEVVDIGCGNGRFGHFLLREKPEINYTGIDFTAAFLEMASQSLDGRFLRRDIANPGFLSGLDRFDLIVCLATLQHIPGKQNRLALLCEMADHVAEDGRIFLSNWQFVGSERQRRKIRDWDEVGLSQSDVETGDYLLTWQRDGQGIRYVHLLDQPEVAELARAAGLVVLADYRSDGREGDLNLYTILARHSESRN